ncbi:hypothetical protein F5879DRAFT_996303 [Lentinula edodes]|nr:hypothetical protein F5879DRAFT_996303 [Lentinula edodes]
MATLFRWPSPFNLSGLDFDNRTPGEWIELLRSIHSGESTAHIDEQGHLVESSPPPDSATEALEGLKEVERGSADKGTSSQVGIHSNGIGSPYNRESGRASSVS